ncbi:hypothetical protein BDW75DRAFT_235754 [Aspergillus navahoensis]
MAKDTRHPTLSTFEIKVVEPEDIPTITELWYNTFSIPQNLKMFPDTPGVRQWWDEVVDITQPSFIVVYTKWDLNPQQSGQRFPPWHEESDRKACNELFGMLVNKRNKLFRDKQFYYLDMLATYPGYQRQGVPAYVDTHHAAAPLYQKFGFHDRKDLEVNLHRAIPMVREPRLKN